MSDQEPPPGMDAGVSAETHKLLMDQLKAEREKNATLAAKQAVHDEERLSVIKEHQPAVSAFLAELANDAQNAPWKKEIQPMERWCAGVAESTAVEANLPIMRTLVCASATVKKARDEASQQSDLATSHAATLTELEKEKADHNVKKQRIAELEGLLDERTKHAEDMQEALAKAGVLKETLNFSRREARENVGSSGSAAAGSSSAAPTVVARDTNLVTSGLMDFVKSAPSRGGLRIAAGSSSNGHPIFGATGEFSGIEEAMRA